MKYNTPIAYRIKNKAYKIVYVKIKFLKISDLK